MLLQYEDFEKYRCSNNTSGIDYHDGITYCGVQSFLLHYAFIGLTTSWIMQPLDWLARIRFRIRCELYWYVPVSLSLILPLVSVAMLLDQKSYGRNVESPICWGNFQTPSSKLNSFFFPCLILVGIGIVCFLEVIVFLVRLILTSRHEKCQSVDVINDGGGEEKFSHVLPSIRSTTLGVLIGHLKFTLAATVAFSAVWISVFFRVFNQFKNYHSDMESYHKWRDCVAANYDGVNDSSWRSVCGPHASVASEFISTKISIAFEASNGIVAGMICLFVVRETLWLYALQSYKVLRRLRTYMISSSRLSVKSLPKYKIAVDVGNVDDDKCVQVDDNPDNAENSNIDSGREKAKRAPKSSNIDQSVTNNFRKRSSFWSRNGFSVAPLTKAAWNIGFVSLQLEDNVIEQVCHIPPGISSVSQKSGEHKSVELVGI
jgi:hypothetical protein